VSGADIFQDVEPYFKGASLQNASANTIVYGHFLSEKNSIVDEVLVSVFHGPKSFTGENTLEISCHCNRLIIEQILDTLNHAGIRLAEPGEFTKRAFINGRLDLTQAEAISDLINATNKHAVSNALHILDGRLSAIVEEMRQKMIQTAGLLEIDLDFSEEDLDLVDRSIILKYIDQATEMMTSFLRKSAELRFVNEGIRLAIVGQPNAGKSSLLNALLGRSRAIVSDIEGTTRDTVEETINLNDLTVRLIDTAGIREANDEIEKMGVEISYQSIERADCVLLVVDALRGFTHSDEKIRRKAQELEKKLIIVFNKRDLKEADLSGFENAVTISTKTETGLNELKNEISLLFQTSQLEADENIVVSNLRHEMALKNAIEKLAQAKLAIESGFGNEIIALDIRDAIEELSKITGTITSTDVLNDIFMNFCIGK
jgi:tRNA modification GTPase